jgi:heme/copper-type cytochrome/quinol oxidase subunit 2
LLEVSSDFVLPVDKMIKLVITSIDVLHCWTIPGFGIKMDAVPGRLNIVFLKSRLPGVFYGQCSELCGINHGFMPIKLIFHN